MMNNYLKTLITILLFSLIGCGSSLKTTDQISAMLDDIYTQKVLLCVYKNRAGTVIFESPIGNKQYLCTSSIESKRWDVGDTLVIRYRGKLLSDADEKTILSLKPHRMKYGKK